MSFDAHEEKIRKILSGDIRFEIPRNQRKYVWDDKQWKELLDDILYTYKRRYESDTDNNLSINHFLGTFVLQDKEQKFEIIDGQQRITTLLLILSALCVVFNEIENSEEHGITKQYLAGNIGLQSEYLRMENPALKNIQIIIAESCKYRENLKIKNLFDKNLLEKNTGNKNILKCFHFYLNAWTEYKDDVDKLKRIREIILDTKVIHIASEDELDCYDIFEILNARGVDLKESELLKNYIFKYSQPTYTLDTAKDIWLQIEENINICGNDGKNMELFLGHFASYKYIKPTKDEGVFRVLKSNTPKAEVDELLKNLLNASEVYTWFYKIDKSKYTNLNKCLAYFDIVAVRQYRPLYMSLIEVFENETIKISQSTFDNICLFIRNFSFAYNLVMKENNKKIDSIICKLAKQLPNLHKDNIVQVIINTFDPLYPIYDEFELSFLQLGYSHKCTHYTSNDRKKVKYILLEIEDNYRTTTEIVCNTEECNIEHIMNDSDLNPESSKLGNLLLLSIQINSNMKNNNWNEKKISLKTSNLLSVKKFLLHYEQYDDWDEERILTRTKKISKLSYETIWSKDILK